MHNFHPGQKVRCIDSHRCAPLRQDGVYTVARSRGQYVYLADVYPSGGWFLRRFKPLNDLTPRAEKQEASHA